MKEIWKDIEGYEGLYQVSNLGRIKSLKRKDSLGRTIQEKILKLSKTSWGYFRITLKKENKRKNFLVHRLVAKTFIPNPNNYLEVNHKDEDKLNNEIENLEWCDRNYNANYGTIKERLAEQARKRVGVKSPVARKVRCITTGEIFTTIREASKKFNINACNISDCCRGKQKSAGKHPITKERLVWRYYDE